MVPSRQVEYIANASGSNGTSGPTLSMAEQTKMTNELVQNAMNFANDSMHTSLCLQYDPEVVAQTCVYMSGQYCKMRPTEGRRWLDVLDECINMGDLACKFNALHCNTIQYDVVNSTITAGVALFVCVHLYVTMHILAYMAINTLLTLPFFAGLVCLSSVLFALSIYPSILH